MVEAPVADRERGTVPRRNVTPPDPALPRQPLGYPAALTPGGYCRGGLSAGQGARSGTRARDGPVKQNFMTLIRRTMTGVGQ